MAFAFNKKYLLLAVILFFIELSIALFVTDTLIRPFVGDVLVVLLIYCAVRTFFEVDYLRAALGVLIFAFAIEILQYFDYVRMLGLEQNSILSVALGRTFEWLDFAAYSVGFLIISAIEKILQNRENS